MSKEFLHSAATDDIKGVKAGFAAKIHADTRTSNGLTGLMLASRAGHLEVVKTFVAKKANLDLVSNGQWSAMMYAAYNGHDTIVSFLHSKSADPNLSDAIGQTAIMIACLQGHANVLSAIFQGSARKNIPLANVFATNKLRQTAGFYALHYSQRECLALIEREEAIRRPEYDQLMRDEHSRKLEQSRQVQLRQEKELKARDMDVMRSAGMRMAANIGLYQAAESGDLASLQLYYERDGNPRHKNEQTNLTPLEVAYRNGHRRCVTYLEAKDLIESTPFNTWTPKQVLIYLEGMLPLRIPSTFIKQELQAEGPITGRFFVSPSFHYLFHHKIGYKLTQLESFYVQLSSYAASRGVNSPLSAISNIAKQAKSFENPANTQHLFRKHAEVRDFHEFSTNTVKRIRQCVFRSKSENIAQFSLPPTAESSMSGVPGATHKHNPSTTTTSEKDNGGADTGTDSFQDGLSENATSNASNEDMQSWIEYDSYTTSLPMLMVLLTVEDDCPVSERHRWWNVLPKPFTEENFHTNHTRTYKLLILCDCLWSVAHFFTTRLLSSQSCCDLKNMQIITLRLTDSEVFALGPYLAFCLWAIGKLSNVNGSQLMRLIGQIAHDEQIKVSLAKEISGKSNVIQSLTKSECKASEVNENVNGNDTKKAKEAESKPAVQAEGDADIEQKSATQGDKVPLTVSTSISSLSLSTTSSPIDNTSIVGNTNNKRDISSNIASMVPVGAVNSPGSTPDHGESDDFQTPFVHDHPPLHSNKNTNTSITPNVTTQHPYSSLKSLPSLVEVDIPNDEESTIKVDINSIDDGDDTEYAELSLGLKNAWKPKPIEIEVSPVAGIRDKTGVHNMMDHTVTDAGTGIRSKTGAIISPTRPIALGGTNITSTDSLYASATSTTVSIPSTHTTNITIQTSADSLSLVPPTDLLTRSKSTPIPPTPNNNSRPTLRNQVSLINNTTHNNGNINANVELTSSNSFIEFCPHCSPNLSSSMSATPTSSISHIPFSLSSQPSLSSHGRIPSNRISTLADEETTSADLPIQTATKLQRDLELLAHSNAFILAHTCAEVRRYADVLDKIDYSVGTDSTDPFNAKQAMTAATADLHDSTNTSSSSNYIPHPQSVYSTRYPEEDIIDWESAAEELLLYLGFITPHTSIRMIKNGALYFSTFNITVDDVLYNANSEFTYEEMKKIQRLQSQVEANVHAQTQALTAIGSSRSRRSSAVSGYEMGITSTKSATASTAPTAPASTVVVAGVPITDAESLTPFTIPTLHVSSPISPPQSTPISTPVLSSISGVGNMSSTSLKTGIHPGSPIVHSLDMHTLSSTLSPRYRSISRSQSIHNSHGNPHNHDTHPHHPHNDGNTSAAVQNRSFWSEFQTTHRNSLGTSTTSSLHPTTTGRNVPGSSGNRSGLPTPRGSISQSHFPASTASVGNTNTNTNAALSSSSLSLSTSMPSAPISSTTTPNVSGQKPQYRRRVSQIALPPLHPHPSAVSNSNSNNDNNTSNADSPFFSPATFATGPMVTLLPGKTCHCGETLVKMDTHHSNSVNNSASNSATASMNLNDSESIFSPIPSTPTLYQPSNASVQSSLSYHDCVDDDTFEIFRGEPGLVAQSRVYMHYLLSTNKQAKKLLLGVNAGAATFKNKEKVYTPGYVQIRDNSLEQPIWSCKKHVKLVQAIDPMRFRPLTTTEIQENCVSTKNNNNKYDKKCVIM